MNTDVSFRDPVALSFTQPALTAVRSELVPATVHLQLSPRLTHPLILAPVADLINSRVEF